MDCFVASLLAMTDVGIFTFPDHLLCRLPEHVPPRLLVERLLHELADRKPRLHLRPCAHLAYQRLMFG